ncbi:hypothetical protein D1831_13070 [Lactiplantibacillus garii]|uniref:Uncharacterized protein n=1 Tax=Lactiplantibacillus garii TaxID=2306423 RepID=A0A426D466_9LACO|nr:hypothetical protein [Lactiplantibacillus garii]RRK09381.1 hypothetical protein D1831_13070 [Lactiplantibacillus garii]
MGHVQEEATAKSYDESDIDVYEYMATLESHTCDVYGRLDGPHFAVKDRKPGINYPLIMPLSLYYGSVDCRLTGRWRALDAWTQNWQG